MGPTIIWLTGLPASGKTTTALELQKQLTRRGRPVAVLDGDDLRRGLNSDLGFSDADRSENVRRTAEVARIIADLRIVTIVSLISPLRAQRAQARAIAGETRFLEVFIDAPLALCERRDPKGLYRRAREGSLTNLTGVGAVYEAPSNPDLHLRMGGISPEDAASRILDAFLSAG